MKQRVLIPLVLAVVSFCNPGPLSAQQPAPGASGVIVQMPEIVRLTQDASNTREQLRSILRAYPEAVGEILRRDPSLMSRPDYMAS